MATGDYESYLKAATVGEAWKVFLESVPPNTPKKFDQTLFEARLVNGVSKYGIFTPRIEVFCDEDNGLRRFSPIEAVTLPPEKRSSFHYLTFVCPDCRIERKTIAFVVDRTSEEMTIIKLGESPEFGGPISKRVRKLLGEDLDLFRKGQRCESQSLGIGAAGYFRRIVENQWRKLVEEIRDVAVKVGETDLTDYEAALAETRFAAAVERLKDRIPARLRLSSGDNPLLLLHKALSVGIHELSDVENLDQAKAIRVVISELFEQVSEVLADRSELAEAVKRLKQARP